MSFLCSCSMPENQRADDEYYTNTKMSVTEYEVFIADKKSTVLPRIMAHYSSCNSIAMGDAADEAEDQSLLTSINTITEVINSVTHINPATGYENTRELFIEYLQSTNDILTELYTLVDSDSLTAEKAESARDELGKLSKQIQNV